MVSERLRFPDCNQYLCKNLSKVTHQSLPKASEIWKKNTLARLLKNTYSSRAYFSANVLEKAFKQDRYPLKSAPIFDTFFGLDFLEKLLSFSSNLRPQMQIFLPKCLMEPSRVKKGRHAFRLVKMHTKRMSALPRTLTNSWQIDQKHCQNPFWRPTRFWKRFLMIFDPFWPPKMWPKVRVFLAFN